jgi:hypothetical protein
LTSPASVLELGPIPSAPQSGLSAEAAAKLPTDAPGAPWHSQIEGALWFQTATPGARSLLPTPLAARARAPFTVGGLVSYSSGPIGPYREVFGAPLIILGGPPLTHVAFMAVDSPVSVVGGRRNWALPKVLAHFEGSPGRPGRVTTSGQGWALSVTTTSRRRRFPVWGSFKCAQVAPNGDVRSFTVRLRGRSQAASVEVEHAIESSLAAWLCPGRHPAILFSGKQTVTRPRA